MDAFAGLDGLSASSSKKLSLEEQRKQRESKTTQFNRDLDWLSHAKSSSPASIPSFSPSITPQRTASASPAISEASRVSLNSTTFEDDDVFGLFSSAPPKKAPSPTLTPASSSPNPHHGSTSLKANTNSSSYSSNYVANPSRLASTLGNTNGSVNRSTTSAFQYDRQLAELTEMGFEPVDGKRALLAMNGSVNGSVNWLMAEAQGMPLPTPRSSRSSLNKPFGNAELADFSTQASQFTSSVFSKASTLFSKGRKELEKAYNQYQHQGTTAEPAWMRDKAKHDARRASPVPEALNTPGLPPRPRSTSDFSETDQQTKSFQKPVEPMRLAEPKNTHKLGESRSQSVDPPSAPKSRAELFRQRQMQRGNRTPDSPAASPPPVVADEKTSSTVPTSAIDLLNLHTPLPDSELSATSRDIYATSRELGTTSFRNGDFEGAVSHYTTAIQVLPSSHSLRTILLANRAAAFMKAGNPQQAFEDTLAGINALPTRGRDQTAEDGTSMADIWVKLVTRHAQSAEHMEKFSVALKAWELLLNHGYASPTVLEAKRRCLAALNPENIRKASVERSAEPPKSRRRGWGTTGAMPSSQAGKEALEKVKQQHTQQAAEERERDRLRDEISARVDAWKQGNERDLRTLLATLPAVLWEGCGWTPVSSAELVVPRKVKIVYMKAVARTHPDKISASAPVATKMIAQSVFVVLQTAWDTFRADNNL